MSINVGVYVLETQGIDGNVEYRVACGREVEHIFSSPDIIIQHGSMFGKGHGLNTDELQRHFGDSQVYVSWLEVSACVAELLRVREVAEHGVSYLSYPQVQLPRILRAA